MMDNTERMQILQQVESGQVSVEDAIGMMSAPEAGRAPEAQPAPTGGETAPLTDRSGRWLRVRVTDLETGKRRVSVNVPLKLMKWGIKIGTRFAPELEGVDMEELLAELDGYGSGHLVEVEDADDGQRVEVFIE
jgi:hypothetical protein